MKAELGLDERDPSCFLHTYSVVMVLRKVRVAQDLLPALPTPLGAAVRAGNLWGGG